MTERVAWTREEAAAALGIGVRTLQTAVTIAVQGLAANRTDSSAPDLSARPRAVGRSFLEGLAPMAILPLAARFWAKVTKVDGPGCWLWIGANTADGWHGRIQSDGKLEMAHRVSWVMEYGPIPPGLQVLHACDTPACVRPTHLMLGSQTANMIDAARKGRMGVGKHATHCKRGHAFEGNTYIHPTTGRRSCHECIRRRNAARARGVPLDTVKRWAGHSSVRVTADTYAHLVWEGAAGMVDEAVG